MPEQDYPQRFILTDVYELPFDAAAIIPLPKDQRSAGEWFNVNAGFERNTANAPD